MEKEYMSPVVQQVPLMAEQTVCSASTEDYRTIYAEFDSDSD